jgi:hypothetical protein
MLFDQRVIFSDNGVLTDISIDINDYRSGSFTLPFVAGQDYLFIGTFLPFNHRYFDIGTANNVASTIIIEAWDGKDFSPVVDILDQTRAGAVSFAQDGFIRWSSSNSQVWRRELESTVVPGLSGTNIPSFFWVRLQFSTSLLSTTSINFIGSKFSKDSQLFSYYPDLNNTSLMAAFASGKTSWEEQHFIAADQIIFELKRKNLILSGDQLLDYELFLEPSVHKVAELIYSGLGQSFEDKRKAAEYKYILTLDQGYLRIDSNGDGKLAENERISRTGFLTR